VPLRKVVTSVGLVVVAGCSFRASCGAGRTLDMTNVETLVKAMMTERAGVEPTVDCPDREPVAKGHRFDCRIGFGDLAGVATVEQMDDQTSIAIESVTGVLVSRKLEALLITKVAAQVEGPVQVDCGPRVRRSTPGDTFRCHATYGAAGRLAIEITVKDDRGSVDFTTVAAVAPGGGPASPSAGAPP